MMTVQKWGHWARIKYDAYVSSSSPGGSTGGEVAVYDCRLVQSLNSLNSSDFDLLYEVGRPLSFASDDIRNTCFLFQRLSVLFYLL